MKREKQINFKDLISEIIKDKETLKSLSDNSNNDINIRNKIKKIENNIESSLNAINERLGILEDKMIDGEIKQEITSIRDSISVRANNNEYFDPKKSVQENLKDLEKKWSIKNVQLSLYNFKTEELFKEHNNEKDNDVYQSLLFSVIFTSNMALLLSMFYVKTLSMLPNLSIFILIFIIITYGCYQFTKLALKYIRQKKFENKLKKERGRYADSLYAKNQNYLNEPLMKAMLKREFNQEVKEEDFVVTNLKDFKIENPSLFPIKLRISKE